MLSAKDKALLIKLFYVNELPATIALYNFRVQKNVRSRKRPLTAAGLIQLIQWFEKTGTLEDSARSGRPYLIKARSPRNAAEIEASAFYSAADTSSARETLGHTAILRMQYSSWNI